MYIDSKHRNLSAFLPGVLSLVRAYSYLVLVGIIQCISLRLDNCLGTGSKLGKLRFPWTEQGRLFHSMYRYIIIIVWIMTYYSYSLSLLVCICACACMYVCTYVWCMYVCMYVLCTRISLGPGPGPHSTSIRKTIPETRIHSLKPAQSQRPSPRKSIP
jgi:hypothetical protein